MSTPLVSVVVPVRDDADALGELVARLETQTLESERFEVVVGDDGSRPGSLHALPSLDGRLRVVSGPPRTSYAARNRAARDARGDVLAFCDSDCLPEPTWLERGLDALERADVVAGQVAFDAPRPPTVWSLLTIDMFLDQERNVQLSQAVTANLFVRCSLFEELGAFDESLPSGGDYDFVQRAVERGATLVFARDAVVHHPTIDGGRAFLRKVWLTNRWAGYRRARAERRPELRELLTLVPLLGVALARRRALRAPATLARHRLRASGIAPRVRDDFRAMPVLYLVVAYAAGLAQVAGWLAGSRSARAPVRLGAPIAGGSDARRA